MSLLSGTPSSESAADPTGSQATVPAGAPTPQGAPAGDGVPVLASGVELLGEMAGSGYRRPPSLVRRADGQVLQLTTLLYLVLAEIDGQRDYSQIAERVSARFGRLLHGEDVRTLVDGKLRPLGLLREPDGSDPEVRKANPLLALRFRWVASDPHTTRRLTAPFAWLFHPIAVVLVVAAFVATVWWVLFERGLGFAAHQAFTSPGLLLAVFAITIVSAGFHEFGHAAAARYGGATPGAMGAGLYLVSPAFYTDVTDSYRLGRGGRLRTDLGGLYFNAIIAVGIFGLWWLTGWDALLLVIGTQLIQMVRQLPPLVRFDGYHVLADLTGVPDLFHQIKPTLAGLWPTRWQDPSSRLLKPWARAVVTLWVLVVVPLLALTVLITVLTLPRIISSAAVSLVHQWSGMLDRFGAGDVLGGLAKVLAVVAVALPVFGMGYMLTRSVRQLVRRTWTATRGRPARQAVAAVLALAIVGGLAYAWWPHGNWRPIRATERGTLQDVLPAAYHADSAGLAEGRQRTAVTAWPADAGALPSADHPRLAVVLVPRAGSKVDGKPAPTWVFPFNKPAPPGAGDNQTLAVNTRNGTAVYDVAFALVWADSNTVLNKNEAYAFADCQRCRATAISFQVLLIVGHSDTVVPQNLSEAVSYGCISCLVQAMAVQLVLTLPTQPSQSELQALTALWQQIQQFGQHLQGLSFAEIHARLTQYEQQITDLLKQDAGQPASPSASATPSGSSDTASPGASDSGAAPVDGASGSSEGAGSSGSAGSSGTAGSTDQPTSPTDSAAPTASDTATPTATDGSVSASTEPSSQTSGP